MAVPTTPASGQGDPRLRRARGFTLIETMMVILIIGIMAAVAYPRINIDSFRVNSAVQGVTSSLTYAQRLSVTLQHDVRVAFDVPNRRLRIHEDKNNNGTIDANERVTYLNLEDGVTFGLGAAAPATYSTGGSGPATVNFVGTQGALPVVVFRRDGSASENGGFYLNTVRGLATNSTSSVRAGEVVRSSGRVIWYSYGSGAWKRGY